MTDSAKLNEDELEDCINVTFMYSSSTDLLENVVKTDVDKVRVINKQAPAFLHM